MRKQQSAIRDCLVKYLCRLIPSAPRNLKTPLHVRVLAVLISGLTLFAGLPYSAGAGNSKPARAGKQGLIKIHPPQAKGETGQLDFTASSGFRIQVRKEKGFTVFRGESPSSEVLELKTRVLPGGITELGFGDTVVRSIVRGDGAAMEALEIRTSRGQAVQFSLQRQMEHLRSRGINSQNPRDLDLGAYNLLVESATSAASPEFWQLFSEAIPEMDAEIPGIFPVSCFWAGFRCMTELVVWAGTIAALVSLCGGTIGAGCIGAILFHEASSAGVLADCVGWLNC